MNDLIRQGYLYGTVFNLCVLNKKNKLPKDSELSKFIREKFIGTKKEFKRDPKLIDVECVTTLLELLEIEIPKAKSKTKKELEQRKKQSQDFLKLVKQQSELVTKPTTKRPKFPSLILSCQLQNLLSLDGQVYTVKLDKKNRTLVEDLPLELRKYDIGKFFTASKGTSLLFCTHKNAKKVLLCVKNFFKIPGNAENIDSPQFAWPSRLGKDIPCKVKLEDLIMLNVKEVDPEKVTLKDIDTKLTVLGGRKRKSEETSSYAEALLELKHLKTETQRIHGKLDLQNKRVAQKLHKEPSLQYSTYHVKPIETNWRRTPSFLRMVYIPNIRTL